MSHGMILLIPSRQGALKTFSRLPLLLIELNLVFGENLQSVTTSICLKYRVHCHIRFVGFAAARRRLIRWRKSARKMKGVPTKAGKNQ